MPVLMTSAAMIGMAPMALTTGRARAHRRIGPSWRPARDNRNLIVAVGQLLMQQSASAICRRWIATGQRV
jgi:hypothetical protein